MDQPYRDIIVFAAISLFVVGKRLGCLEDPIPPESREYMDSIEILLESMLQLMYGLPLHKLWRTKAWDTMVSTQGFMLSYAGKLVKEKIKEMEENRDAAENMGEASAELGKDFLTYMICSGKMGLEEIAVNAVDIIAAGLDTVSSKYVASVQGCMY